MSVGVSLLLCLPGGCSGVMLPFANPLFPDLSGTGSVIPTGNPSTWNLSPEGSLGCLHGTSSHRGDAGLGGVKGKELFAPSFHGVQGKIPGQRKCVFPFGVKQFLCFKTYTEGPKNSEFHLFVALKF